MIRPGSVKLYTVACVHFISGTAHYVRSTAALRVLCAAPEALGCNVVLLVGCKPLAEDP